MQIRRKNIPGRATVSPEDLGIFNEQQGSQCGWNVMSKGESERRGSGREHFKWSVWLLCGEHTSREST